MPVRGSLVLVVGPSGAGKDTLICEAQAHFTDDSRIAFARRSITRPADPEGEAHEAVSATEFERRQSADGFMLAWQAHGLWYGIPRGYEFDLAAGRSVVANVSRTVIDEARQRFQPLSVAHVIASPDSLTRRLKERGREDPGKQVARLRRSVAADLSGDDVVAIHNDGLLDDAVQNFIACLTDIMDGVRRTCAAE